MSAKGNSPSFPAGCGRGALSSERRAENRHGRTEGRRTQNTVSFSLKYENHLISFRLPTALYLDRRVEKGTAPSSHRLPKTEYSSWPGLGENRVIFANTFTPLKVLVKWPRAFFCPGGLFFDGTGDQPPFSLLILSCFPGPGLKDPWPALSSSSTKPFWTIPRSLPAMERPPIVAPVMGTTGADGTNRPRKLESKRFIAIL
jgi:hypothetical protein